MIPYIVHSTTPDGISVEFLNIVLLSGLLVLKVVTTGFKQQYLRRLNKLLNIAIIPLLIVFLVTTAFKILEVAA